MRLILFIVFTQDANLTVKSDDIRKMVASTYQKVLVPYCTPIFAPKHVWCLEDLLLRFNDRLFGACLFGFTESFILDVAHYSCVKLFLLCTLPFDCHKTLHKLPRCGRYYARCFERVIVERNPTKQYDDSTDIYS